MHTHTHTHTHTLSLTHSLTHTHTYPQCYAHAQTCIGLLRNDTVIGDPLYTVPLFDNRERHLCYEIHGDAGQHFNLISDECLSVNGLYAQRTVTVDSIPENLNVLSEIGVRAVDRSGNCVNVSVRVDGCATSVNGQPMIRYNQFGVRVRRSDSQVRVSVPNCEDANVVMRVFCDSVDGVSMIRFVVTRGLNLRETAHGFIGNDSVGSSCPLLTSWKQTCMSFASYQKYIMYVHTHTHIFTHRSVLEHPNIS